MLAPDLTTLSDDDLDRLLDDAVLQASNLDIPSKQPSPQISSQPTQGKQASDQPLNHASHHPKPEGKQLTKPQASQADGKPRKFVPVGPGRPKGGGVGKLARARLKREREIIKDALGVQEKVQKGERITPREFFETVLNDPAKAPEDRRDAARQLAAIDARGKEVAKVEEINWDNLTSAQRRQGIDACKLLTDLRHISHRRDPEFGMV